MNNVTVTSVAPCVQTVGHLTDDELIAAVKHAYPRLGPTLSVLVARFEQCVDRLEGSVTFEGFNPERISCPHCGSALLLHSTNQQQEHLDAT